MGKQWVGEGKKDRCTIRTQTLNSTPRQPHARVTQSAISWQLGATDPAKHFSPSLGGKAPT